MTMKRAIPRALATGALAAALALLLVACGGETIEGPGSEQDAQTAPALGPEDIENTVVFAGPGGGFAEAFREAFASFEQEHGVKVDYVEGLVAENFSRVQTQVRAGASEIDVFIVSPRDTPLGIAQGLFQPLDTGLVSELDALTDFARMEDDIAAKVAFSPDGLIYNKQVFEENGWPAPTSWEDLFNETYADCMVPLHPSTSSTYLGFLNYVASGGDYAGFDATLDRFRPIADRVPAVAQSPVDAQDLVQQGVACLSSSSQGRALTLQDDNVVFVIPDEGAPVGTLTAAVVKDAPHPVAANLLLNSLLSEETQSLVLEKAFWSPTNASVTPDPQGAAADLSTAKDFDELGYTEIPPGAYEELESWIRDWDGVFAD